MKKTTRFLSLMLAVLMLSGLLMPVEAQAASGTCGNSGSVKWSYSNGTLTISGSGAMTNYTEDPYSGTTNAPWWSYNSSISNIVIGKGVTSIGNYAFYCCGSDYELLSVKIASTVKKIGKAAFARSKVVRVSIPSSVTSMGGYAFSGCEYLGQVSLSKNLTAIPEDAFSYCGDLFEMRIPHGVTSIGREAFSYCNNLNLVSIPSTVKSIGNYAFSSEVTGTHPDRVFYNGKKAAFNRLTAAEGNDGLTNAWRVYINPFKDIPGTSSCLEAVQWCYGEGVVRGKTKTSFAPNSNLTRGEFCTMLYRLWNKPVLNGLTAPFKDIANSNHRDAIIWCYNMGIISGYRIHGKLYFKPGDPITRGNVLVMLYKLAKWEPAYMTPWIDNPFRDIKDTNKNITAYKWAYQNGITTAAKLDPGSSCKRSAMAIFVYKYNLTYGRKH